MTDVEIWKQLPTELNLNKYLISSHARVKTIKTGKIREGYEQGQYIKCALRTNNNKYTIMLMHRLVAFAFLPNPENKPTVDHIDRNKRNNQLNNLRWYTMLEQSDNREHRENNVKLYRPVLQLDKNTKTIINKFDSCTEAANKLNIRISDIVQVCKGKQKTCGGFIFEYYEEIDNSEIWKPITLKNCTGMFVSNKGGIKLKTGKISASEPNDNGYIVTTINGKLTRVHTLICTTFIGLRPTSKHIVNHKNGIKHDNRPENLEWYTKSENILHAMETGLNPIRKPVNQIDKDTNKIINTFKSGREASKTLNINDSTIYNVCRGIGKTAGGFKWEYIK